MRKPLFFWVLFCLISTSILAQESEKQADHWQPLRFFLGEWIGNEGGKPGTGKGERSYQFLFGETYFYHDNSSRFEPREHNPEGETHHDWMIFSYDKNRRKLMIRQFNSESFVNYFVQDSIASDGEYLRFVTERIENLPDGFRARISYTILDENHFGEKFEIAGPGKDFQTILTNQWRRK